MIARMVARQTRPNQQRASFEGYFGPDGVVFMEAVFGNVIGAAVCVFGGALLAAITPRGLPESVGLWMMAAGIVFSALVVARALQAVRAGRAFRRHGRP